MAGRISPEDAAVRLRALHAKVRRRQIRGLVWIAVGVIGFSVVRAGVHRVFGVGWWRVW